MLVEQNKKGSMFMFGPNSILTRFDPQFDHRTYLVWPNKKSNVGTLHVGATDEDILHYYPLAKTQQKKGQVA
jgi:hypothetical protein